jgi:hypothetical protein
MPCYSVQTMSVEFVASNRDLLKKALQTLGWRFDEDGDRIELPVQSITLDLLNRKAEVPAYAQGFLNQLKRTYSLMAVTLAAQSKGWQMRQGSDATGGTIYR